MKSQISKSLNSLKHLPKTLKHTPKTLFQNSKSKENYQLTRWLLLRVLGFTYLFAFLSLAFQVIPLIGETGLTPANLYLDRVQSTNESPFLKLPTIFHFGISDTALTFFAWLGVIISLILLIGYANSISLFILWVLYTSFVNIGQNWYSFGWEIQLLETGFLAMFLTPLIDPRPFPKAAPPPVIIWLFRWLSFRIHLGSGLIKLRGAECWKQLTCLFYHYETQPIPNPLSPLFHFKPKIVHKIGVLFSHLTLLIIPWFSFGPKNPRRIAGVIMLSFQLILILSGNLSFLNWVTIIPIIAIFDDEFPKKNSSKIRSKKKLTKIQNYTDLNIIYQS